MLMKIDTYLKQQFHLMKAKFWDSLWLQLELETFLESVINGVKVRVKLFEVFFLIGFHSHSPIL